MMAQNIAILDGKGSSFPQSVLKGWQFVCFGDICDQDRRIIEPGSELAMKIPYLSLENVESNTGRILHLLESVSNSEGQSTTFAFDTRHVLYGKLRPYLNKVALPDFEGRCTTELIPLLPKPGISRRYLALLLRRPATVNGAMHEITGSRMPRASMKHILKLRVSVPDSQEIQEKLADIFESRMMAIETARTAIQEQLGLLEVLSARMLEGFPETLITTQRK